MMTADLAWLKDVLDGLLALSGFTLAVIAFYKGLLEWRVAQRWKRAERLDSFIEGFEKDEMLRLACQILDWTVRSVDAPGGQGKVSWTSGDVLLALRVHYEHPGVQYDPPQALIRDALDRLLTFLGRLESAVTTGLVDADPTLAYFGYWLERLQSMDMHTNHDPAAPAAMRHYVAAYGDARAIDRLIELADAKQRAQGERPGAASRAINGA
ncbi:MAG: hypothetical protein IT379_24215 [Deltaproteobacteria bacterium]|nr:hypothetical protein [Deltaproteobacteria bacterium]